MAKTLNSVLHKYIKRVNRLMLIIERLRKHLDIAFNIMTPEQQATFLVEIRLSDADEEE